MNNFWIRSYPNLPVSIGVSAAPKEESPTVSAQRAIGPKALVISDVFFCSFRAPD